jgi:16S rRNA (uracil1498-N3)-methyltransferase
MTRRRWIADAWTATTASLTGEQAEHLARVLRASPGQVYDVVAGGFLHRAEIISVRSASAGQAAEVLFTLQEELESDSALPLLLLLAVFKFDHMEWAIEKATELGVSRITPVLARRTEKHLAQASTKRAERSKQSRRTTIPEITDPIALKEALGQTASPVRILLSETEQFTSIAVALQQHSSTTDSALTHALAIGPEGGWTQAEMALFAQHEWQPVTLGPRILRAETAAIAAIAILSSHLG